MICNAPLSPSVYRRSPRVSAQARAWIGVRLCRRTRAFCGAMIPCVTSGTGRRAVADLPAEAGLFAQLTDPAVTAICQAPSCLP